MCERDRRVEQGVVRADPIRLYFGCSRPFLRAVDGAAADDTVSWDKDTSQSTSGCLIGL
jgi:hypothetical protein